MKEQRLIEKLKEIIEAYETLYNYTHKPKEDQYTMTISHLKEVVDKRKRELTELQSSSQEEPKHPTSWRDFTMTNDEPKCEECPSKQFYEANTAKIMDKIEQSEISVTDRIKPYISDQESVVSKWIREDAEEARKSFCLWYYAQSQPLDANNVFRWFTDGKIKQKQ